MFTLPDSWVWDFWFADDGERHHLFFLYASRALHEPDARHYRARSGTPCPTTSCTGRASKTPSCAGRRRVGRPRDVDRLGRAPPGRHVVLLLHRLTLTPAGNVQRVGYATSSDLLTWTKADENPVLAADARWYETIADGQWHDEAFRDPWVFADPRGDGWHMLLTARGRTGPADDRGVVGHAWSPDLRTWELRAPLTAPGQGFGQLEVTQVEVVDGVPVLLFSCLASDMSASRREGTTGGVWAAPAASLLGPYDVAAAQQLTDASMYSGRLVRDRAGRWVMLAFHHDAPDGSFVGSISDPMPVRWQDGRLVIEHATERTTTS